MASSFKHLRDFIQKQMRMSHIYQPVMIKTILRGQGRASTRAIAAAFLAEDESQRLWQQAGEAGRNGRSYVLITVLFTSALFCGGTASKFDSPWVRRAVLALGLTAFIFAAIRLLLLPTRL